MWEIKRNDIIPKLDILTMVPSKLAIPASDYIWVRGKGSIIKMSLSSYIGSEVKLRGKGNWPFEDFYLDRRSFVPFVLAAKELKDKHTFQFEKKGKQLVVKHGNRSVTFDSQPHVKGYGNVSRIKKLLKSTIPLSSDLRDMLICGKNCARSDTVQPHLSCVYLQKSNGGVRVKLYASSNKIMYLGKGKVTKGKVTTSIPFPLHLIDLLGNESVKKIMCSDKYIVLVFEHGLVWQPVSQEAIKDFPVDDIKSNIAISDKKKVTFVCPSRRFSLLMVRLGYYLQSAKRQDWVVYVKGISGKSKINVSTSIAGAKFNEKIPTTDIIPKDFEIEWPLDIMGGIFDYLSKKTKKLALTVRVDNKHGVSYVTVGNYWLGITSRQE